jgi:hypothetical protein
MLGMSLSHCNFAITISKIKQCNLDTVFMSLSLLLPVIQESELLDHTRK